MTPSYAETLRPTTIARRIKLSCQKEQAATRVERDWELTERAAAPGELDVPLRQHVPPCLIPHQRRRERGRPEQMQFVGE